MPPQYFHFCFLRLQRLLLLLFTFAYAPYLFAQSANESVASFLSNQRDDYTRDEKSFLIVKDTVLQADVLYKRKLVPGYLLIKAANPSAIARRHIIGLANEEWKLSPRLARVRTENIRSYLSGSDNRFVVTSFDVIHLLQFLDREHIEVLRSDTASGSVLVIVKNPSELEKVIHNDVVTFVDIRTGLPVEETLNSTQDLSVNYVSWIHHRFPEITGESLAGSVRERTIEKNDIDLKGRIVSSPLEDPVVSFHANQMATVIAGGGNSSQDSKGIAWGSNVSSSSFASGLADPSSYFSDFGISVQNHSYGFGIENYYGAEARAFDVQCNEQLNLVHVFSAGNRGEETSGDGMYSGIPGFATLTGNMKMAKNIIVVGGHHDDYSVDERNSRGPAFDGRIKPEVAAFGPEGTSDGAAYVSGVALLLQDAFKRKLGFLPPSSLIRLVLALSADDVGEPGPDFTTGFGTVNAKRALQLILSGQFLEGELDQDENSELVFQVPEGVELLRVGLAWNDPAADAGAPNALINDLDVEAITMSSPDIQYPWVLNAYPHTDSLLNVATKGRDSVNNIEVIHLDHPAAGEIKVKVIGKNVTQRQRYVVALLPDTANQFVWTYPLSDDRPEAGSQLTLRWNSTLKADAALLVKINDNEYEVISEAVDLKRPYFRWNLPEGVNRISFKISVADKEFISETFLASPIQNFTVGYSCDEGGLIQWERDPSVDSYVLFNLGEKYLEPILNGTDTSFIFSAAGVSEYFSLAPVFGGAIGRRSLTYDYRNSGALCYYRSFDAQAMDSGEGHLELQLATLYNVSRIVFEKKIGQSFVVLGERNPTDGLVYHFQDQKLDGGLTVYRVAIHLLDGKVVYTNEDTIVYADSRTFIVYPNPLAKHAEQLNVLTDGIEILFELIDLQGRRVYEMTLSTTLLEMSLAEIPTGMYFYRFTRNRSVQATGRLVVE